MDMKTQLYDIPWPHLITDDALNQEEWAHLQTYLQRIQPGPIAANSDNCIKKLVGVEEDPVDLAIHTMLFNKVLYLYEKHYTGLGGKPLDEQLAVALEFRWIGPGFRYGKIHTDIPLKRMSNVLYVSPTVEDPALGTDLYSGPNESDLVHNVGWKSNRIMSFVADQQRTWHNFGNASDQLRVTINMTLGYSKDLIPYFKPTL